VARTWIPERAYEIWERAGRPEGNTVEHWQQAAAQIAAKEQGLEQEVELDGRRRRLTA